MDFEYLHIRLTKEQKERYKNLCEAKGLSQVDCFMKMLDAIEFFSLNNKTNKKAKKKSK
jgi:uncharacterized ferritin-like protein (DUF455 family)